MKKLISIYIIIIIKYNLCLGQCNYNAHIQENITPQCGLPGGQLEVVIDPNIYNITSIGMSFSPDTLFVSVLDTVRVSLGSTHNMVQVDSATWFNNGINPVSGGFNIPFGGNLDLVFDTPGIYYYVCQPHVQLNMKGVIVVGEFDFIWLDYSNSNPLFPPQENNLTSPVLSPGAYAVVMTNNLLGCSFSDYHLLGSNDTIGTSVNVFSQFNINPVNYNTWSMCVIRIDNLGCEVRLKPEFKTRHSSFNITQGDFIAQYLDPQTMIWENIDYSIDSNGDAIGFWGDSLGTIVNFQNAFERYIRVKFNQSNPTANLGLYETDMRVWQCDQNGNLLNIISDTSSISLTLDNTPCAGFNYSFNVTDVSCFGDADGMIDLNVTGGTSPYYYNWNSNQFNSSSQDIINLHAGDYNIIIQDSDSCFLYDTITINQPDSNIPDTVFTENITTSNALLKFTSSNNINYYRFRYREVGSLNWSVVGLGFNDGIACLDSVKQINNLFSNTDYEWQIRVFGLDSCISDWSISHLFTTTCLDYDYNIIYPYCGNLGGGSIDLNVYGTDNYNFVWSDNSSTEDIFNISSGVYYVDIFSDNNCSFTDTFFISVLNPFLIDTILILDASCYGVNDGQIIVNVSGGSSPYIQNWGFNSPYQLYSGNYYFEVIDANGCVVSDSVFVNQPVEILTQNTQFICSGQSVLVGSNVYDVTGFYIDTLISSLGCDSIVYTDLNVSNVLSSTNYVTSCYNYNWNGINYDSSGIYSFVINSTTGCDSVIILDLTINNSSSSTTNITACDSYDWNGITYTSSGSYDYVTQNTNGCDSVATLNLTINNSNIGIDTQTACDTYTWIDGNTYTSSNNTATYTLTNASGCDSVVTLDLTINNTINYSQDVAICYGDIISVGVSIYDTTGVYTDILTNINGCDSLIVTYLTVSILNSEIIYSLLDNQLSVDVVSINGLNNTPYSYIWSTGETNEIISPQYNGFYWVVVYDANGCYSDTSFYEIDFINNVQESSFNDDFVIYPNPTINILNVISPQNISYKLTIRDNLGKICYEFFSKNKKSLLDLSFLEKGSYYLTINSKSTILTKKLIIN